MVFFYIELTLIKGMIQYNYMQKPLTIEQFRDQINAGNASDPLIFLESVMNGQDPRRLSAVYKLALDIEEFGDGVPSPEEWADLFHLIKTACKFHTVSMSESTMAAKTCAEYLHAKRKSIENIDGTNGTLSVEPLNKKEIRNLLKIYESEF